MGSIFCVFVIFALLLYIVGHVQANTLGRATHRQKAITRKADTSAKDDPDGSDSNEDNNREEPGICFNWESTHYKTFDGRIFSFSSNCAHVLVKGTTARSFSVVVQNHPKCETEPSDCSRIIKIQYGGETYTLKQSDQDQNPVFSSTKKRLSIPGKHHDLRIKTAAHFTVVSLEEVGLTIKWNGKQLVQVEAQKGLWGRTEGLCGKLDGDESNDMVDENGKSYQKVTDLAKSWKDEEKDHECNDKPSDKHACSPSVDDPKSRNATNVCLSLLMMNARFAACQKVIDSFLLFDACRWDFCGCEDEDAKVCACETVSVYARGCIFKGVKDVINWRDANTCPMHCTGGRVYRPCGPPSGQPSCWSKNEETKNGEECFEGCYCPEGTVWHDNSCITRDKCPCTLNGKIYKPGSQVPKECNTCTCKNGEWVCTQKNCDGNCIAAGDPHYTTFDGKKYDFMGRCSYYLVKTKTFSIEGENIPCIGVNFQMGQPFSATAHLPSCTRSVTVKIAGHTVHLKHERKVAVDGQDITDLPYQIDNITIRHLSSIYMQVDLPNGIYIKWDGITCAYITIPTGFKEKTKGLCGTFNYNQTDDFLTVDGKLEVDVNVFANFWKVNKNCEDLNDGDKNPCDVSPEYRPAAEKHCQTIKSKVFSSCHKVADPKQHYRDCLYDMCSCADNPPSMCLCPTISAYAEECARHGVTIDWRSKVKECAVSCSGGQFYQTCGDPCARTCRDLAMKAECKAQCVEGCNCLKGHALNEEGKCVPIPKCKCEYEGAFFEPGYKGLRPGDKGLETCTCTNAVWNCHPATDEEEDKLPDIDPSSRCKENMVYSKCVPVEPATCKNMQTSNSPCKPGCKCKNGYVLDTTTKKCVKASKCPCQHGGKTHNEDDTIKINCNTCHCHQGKWDCTNRQCPGKCSVWGDSHFKTFDGKYFDFRGECKYIMAAGTFDGTSFEISIQNVQCETACTKSVTILVKTEKGEDSISLTGNKSLPNQKNLKHVTVREAGLFLVIESANLGLVVQWDKETRIYVTVDPHWKGRTEGLCGNYNDDDADDFQKPSGEVVVSTQIFGYSWKVDLDCIETTENEDTCEEKPDRKPWAVKKCEILKSALFASCHSEIPIDVYLERCIMDTSSCDQNGDCKILCTALAAYSQECNDRGVPIKWRSQKLCPMKCDDGYNYNPCISTCPVDTCTDLAKNPVSKLCRQESCVEGCAPDPCPSDQIYRNSSHSECIAFKVCKHFCMKMDGVIYREGELMEEDECHKCHCTKHGKKCTPKPCATSTTSIEPTSPTPSLKECSVEEVPSEETRHLVKKKYSRHGTCENDKPIANFTRCAGSCSLSFKFNSTNRKFESGCSCCASVKTQDLTVELECTSGKTVSEKVTVPTECSCGEGCK